MVVPLGLSQQVLFFVPGAQDKSNESARNQPLVAPSSNSTLDGPIVTRLMKDTVWISRTGGVAYEPEKVQLCLACFPAVRINRCFGGVEWHVNAIHGPQISRMSLRLQLDCLPTSRTMEASTPLQYLVCRMSTS